MLQNNRYIFLRAVKITAFNAMINEIHNTTTAGEVREILLHLTRVEIDALNLAAARMGMTAPQMMANALTADYQAGMTGTLNPVA